MSRARPRRCISPSRRRARPSRRSRRGTATKLFHRVGRRHRADRGRPAVPGRSQRRAGAGGGGRAVLSELGGLGRGTLTRAGEPDHRQLLAAAPPGRVPARLPGHRHPPRRRQHRAGGGPPCTTAPPSWASSRARSTIRALQRRWSPATAGAGGRRRSIPGPAATASRRRSSPRANGCCASPAPARARSSRRRWRGSACARAT